MLAWPVAAMIGRKFKTTTGGVPIVRLNRIVHDFPHTEPGLVARKTFRYYSFAAAALIGFTFAYMTTDNQVKGQNGTFSRPDLKPYPAMVSGQQGNEHTHNSMMKSQYVNQKESEGKRSPLYRYFMARDADFSSKENPYQVAHPDDVWDERKGNYSSYSNNYGAHQQ